MKKTIFLVSVALVLGLVIGCPNDTPTPTVVAVPTVMSNNMVLTDNSEIDFSVRLELRSATAYATVHYKFSGQTNYTEIENGATVVIPEGSTSITVKATKGGLTESSEKTLNFSKATVAKPVVEPASGYYNEGEVIKITIGVPTGASVYYTTNGNEPTKDSTEYITPFNITISATPVEVKAIAIKTGMINSDVVSAVYEKSLLTMVTLPAGEFWMGSTAEEVAAGTARYDEDPERLVTLNSFMLGSTEVTEAQWEAVMTDWPDDDPAMGDTHPARYISWYDAIEFCNALTRAELTEEDVVYTITKTEETNQGTWTVAVDVTKNGYRLPTEAEWEYAAGGAQARPTLYAGTSDPSSLGGYAVYNTSNPSTVESKSPVSETYTLYDMNGNVWEWCWDRYGENYYSQNGNNDNPKGPASGFNRVIRGGSWSNDLSDVRVAYRNYVNPVSWPSYIGLRVARNVGN